MKPKKLDSLGMAFGPDNIRDFLPPYAQVRDHHSVFSDFIARWFFSGIGQAEVDTLVAKPGIDKNDALRHIKACLGSWEPKHEHKEAGCAWLMSQWFEEPVPAGSVIDSAAKAKAAKAEKRNRKPAGGAK